jgi:hypothetical protein
MVPVLVRRHDMAATLIEEDEAIFESRIACARLIRNFLSDKKAKLT